MLIFELVNASNQERICLGQNMSTACTNICKVHLRETNILSGSESRTRAHKWRLTETWGTTTDKNAPEDERGGN